MKKLIAVLLLLSPFLLSHSVVAAPLATCFVPSIDYATINAATGDNNCDIIKLASNVYNERIVISRNLTLEGDQSSNTFINGGALGGLNGSTVRIGAGLSVALKNITIENGLATRGGGLYVETGANISTTQVVFKNNSAESKGGHIYSENSLTLLSLTLQNGQAPDGAGIFMNDGVLTLDQFVLENNSATMNGGGIYSSGVAQLTDGILRDNSAGGNGGAVFTEGALNFTNVTASSNSATERGGAIYADRANVTILAQNDEQLTNNSAEYGAGIYANSGSVSVVGTTMSYNAATRDGGAIYVNNQEGARGTGQLIRFQNGTLLENRANLRGGGIKVNSFSAEINMIIDNTLLRQNTGGAIQHNAPSSTLTINNSMFENNNGNTSSGAVQVERVMATISNSTFFDNLSVNHGGAISARSGAQLAIYSSQFLRNIAQLGGAVAVFADGAIFDKLIIANNTAHGDGGGLYLTGIDNSIINSTLSGNQANASGKGSAVYAKGARFDFTTIAYNTGTAAVWKTNGFGNQTPPGQSEIFLNNTLLDNPANDNCAGTIDDIYGSSSIASDSSCSLSSATGNQVSNPQLDPALADNGGNTLTHAINAGSPANGSGTNCPPIDQRNLARPATGCDRGAFELTSNSPTAIRLTSQAVVQNRMLTPIALITALMFTLLLPCRTTKQW